MSPSHVLNSNPVPPCIGNVVLRAMRLLRASMPMMRWLKSTRRGCSSRRDEDHQAWKSSCTPGIPLANRALLPLIVRAPHGPVINATNDVDAIFHIVIIIRDETLFGCSDKIDELTEVLGRLMVFDGIQLGCRFFFKAIGSPIGLQVDGVRPAYLIQGPRATPGSGVATFGLRPAHIIEPATWTRPALRQSPRCRGSTPPWPAPRCPE